jgi:Flp pilus assembly pilin Flp
MTIEEPIFSPSEVEAFRADDRNAAAAIVGLMAGIFTLGLIGYLGVCLWVG